MTLKLAAQFVKKNVFLANLLVRPGFPHTPANPNFTAALLAGLLVC